LETLERLKIAYHFWVAEKTLAESKEVDEKNSNIKNLKHENKKYNETLKNLNEEIDRLSEQKEKYMSNEISSLDEVVIKLYKDYVLKETIVKNDKDSLKKKKKKFNNLDKNKIELEKQIEELKKQFETQNIEVSNYEEEKKKMLDNKLKILKDLTRLYLLVLLEIVKVQAKHLLNN